MRLTVAAVGVTAAMLLAASPGWASPIASPPANCVSVGSPYDYTAQAASACFVVDPLVDVSPLAGGGTQYTYRESNGTLVSEPSPPANFNPLTASASQLVEYALPPRPDTPAAASEWVSEMSRAWFATPPPFLAEVPKSEQIGPPVAPQSPLGSGPVINPATSYPGIYGGYETYLGQGPFTSASDTYYEPHLYGTACHTPGVGTWAGIGSNVGPFGQDGTVSQNGNPNHMSFWQVWLDNVEQATAFLFSVPAGDLVRANVNYQTYNEFYGTVTNVTTGQAQGWSVPLFAGAAPNTGEAEVEKIGGYDLANFGTLTFATSTVNGNALNNYQLAENVIQSGTSTATTNPISGNGSFSVHQTHC